MLHMCLCRAHAQCSYFDKYFTTPGLKRTMKSLSVVHVARIFLFFDAPTSHLLSSLPVWMNHSHSEGLYLEAKSMILHFRLYNEDSQWVLQNGRKKKTKIGGKKQRKYRKDHVYTINLINKMQSITRYGKNKKKNSLAKRKTRPLRYKFSFVRLNLYSIDSSNIYKLFCRMLVVDTVCGSHIIRS